MTRESEIERNFRLDGGYGAPAIPPSVAEFAVKEMARLREINAELLAFIQHVADFCPDERLGQDARAALARAKGESDGR